MAPFTLDHPQVRALLRHQDGAIARRQLIEIGAQPHDIVRMLRRRELAVAFPGVYVHHTGPLTERQREWVAILTAWPAALSGASALPELTPHAVDIVVGPGRKLRLPPGTRVRRSTALDDEVLWNLSPPRVRIEHAIIEVMSRYVAAGDVAGVRTVSRAGTASRRRVPPGAAPTPMSVTTTMASSSSSTARRFTEVPSAMLTPTGISPSWLLPGATPFV